VRYDPTIYLGSAAHYRHGRPAYSPELEAVLTQEASLDGNGRLLDAGCGPGVLTVRLAQGLAEDLPAAAPGPYRLVTFGLAEQAAIASVLVFQAILRR
jgi:predicted O-methyltransferase YrrM